MNRRLFLTAAAILPLAACSAGSQAKFKNFANALYVDMNQVAQKIEQAVIMARADMNAAAAFLEPYMQPVCQIVVTLTTLGNQLIAARAINASDPNVQKALAEANKLATDPIIVSVANTGALPANPLQVLIGIITAVGIIMDLTGNRITPSASVASGA